MNREDIEKFIAEHGNVSKGELVTILIGLVSTVIAISKETTEKKDRKLLWAVISLVIVQCAVLVGIAIYLI